MPFWKVPLPGVETQPSLNCPQRPLRASPATADSDRAAISRCPPGRTRQAAARILTSRSSSDRSTLITKTAATRSYWRSPHRAQPKRGSRALELSSTPVGRRQIECRRKGCTDMGGGRRNRIWLLAKIALTAAQRHLSKEDPLRTPPRIRLHLSQHHVPSKQSQLGTHSAASAPGVLAPTCPFPQARRYRDQA